MQTIRDAIQAREQSFNRLSAALGTAFDYARPIIKHDPADWICENIDLTEDKTSAVDGLVDLSITPYLIDPIRCWNDPAARKMTVVAPEQTGKSSCWKWPAIWKVCNWPGPALVIYPNDDDAADTNQDSVQPLMKAIPELKKQLDAPFAIRKDRYNFTDTVFYFAGAGSPIISKPCQVVVGDEIDFWRTMNEKVSNVRNLDKRTNTFADSFRVLCSSTTTKDGPIWLEFMASSRGYWHLVCLECDQPLRSCDIFLLQWEFEEETHRPIEASIRLICPRCKTEYRESQKGRLNAGGKYIHEVPDELEHRGFQWGKLASPFPGSRWLNIAQAQTAASRRADRETQMYFDNSIRGLPFKPRKLDEGRREALERHFEPLPETNESFVALFFSADTQDNGWYWIVRALDQDECTWLLAYGFETSLEDIDDRWNAKYMGLEPACGIIDEGGHKEREVQRWVKKRAGFYSYKGDARVTEKYTPSKNIPKLIRGNPYHYKGELLYLLYSQPHRSNNYLFLPSDVTDDYLEQIAALKPVPKIKGGDQYEKWEAGDADADHYFDCEKMVILIMDFARENFKPHHWDREPSFINKKKKGTRRQPQQPLDRYGDHD